MYGIQVSSQVSRFADQYASIDLKTVNLTVETKDLLCDANVKILLDGRRYALIGRNGVGKSIFMTCLASGELLPLTLRESLRIMLIRQTLDEDATSSSSSPTVSQELERVPFGLNFTLSERERWSILANQRSGLRGKFAREMLHHFSSLHLTDTPDSTTPDSTLQAETEQMLDRADPALIHKICLSLGISNDMLTRPYSTLSGGWKMRVQLAKAMIYKPDLLLLDEPTNHLDIAGIEWLERLLTVECSGMTIVMVSHNRTFLDRLVTDVLLFKNQKLECFKGNYDTYVKAVADQEAFNEKLQDQLDRKKERLNESIQATRELGRKQGDEKKMQLAATKARKLEQRTGVERNAKGHRFKLNRDRVGYFHDYLDGVDHVQEEKTQSRLKFTVPDPELPRTSLALLNVEDVSFYRRNDAGAITFRLEHVTLRVEPGQRIILAGPNGEGKSTTLAILAGTLTPASGTVTLRTTQVGHFRQDAVAELGRDARSAMQAMQARYPTASQDDLWRQLGSFGLGSPELAVKTPLNQLSGGQRVAYEFAEILFPDPVLLLLDEPNSHLDLDALEALVVALKPYKGGIVFVSHDLSFIADLATHAYWVEGGKVMPIKVNELESRAKRKIKPPI